MKLFPTPVPDDEYIENIRASIAWSDRWRVWLVLFYVCLLVVAVRLFSSVVPILLQGVQPANVPIALVGFVTGTSLGIGFGWVIYGILQSLSSATSGLRVERLLLKYVDAQNLDETDCDQHDEQEPACDER